MKNIFSEEGSQEVITRIEQLTPSSTPLWGKMDVAQMLAHCNVTYEFIFEPEKHKKPSGLQKFFIKLIAKTTVVNNKPYKRNSPTSPQFKIVDKRVFAKEQKRLIDFVRKTHQMGEDQFDGMESYSFGPLTSQEWNNLFYKHLDHHLSQFNV